MPVKAHDNEYAEWETVRQLFKNLKKQARRPMKRDRALQTARRLKGRLSRLDTDDDILCQEALSLISEMEGDLQGAIDHRKKAVALVRQLHNLAAGTSNEKMVFGIYGYDALCNQLNTLATLYHDAGDSGKAVAVLQEAQQLAQQHGIAFPTRL